MPRLLTDTPARPYWRSECGRYEVWHGDCLQIMHTCRYDAIVTDPPYGIGADVAQKSAADQRIAANGLTKAGRGWKDYGLTNWDTSRPSQQTFQAMLSISVPMVVWGGNYFTNYLPPSMGWIAWDKGQRDFSLADFELAWTSENKASRCVVYPRGLALQDGKVHPTQKPVYVMEQCIEYLERGNKQLNTVLDPFTGSGTTGVACVNLGRRFIGIELSLDYCKIAVGRIQRAMMEKGLTHKPAMDEMADPTPLRR